MTPQTMQKLPVNIPCWSTRKLDYKRMLDAILPFVEDDFMFDVDCKLNLHKEKEIFTQQEAQEMGRRLLEIYTIAHCIECEACGRKWRK